MKKIAVASVDKQVCAHFGHCETFEVFTVEDGKIAGCESIANPGHRPGFLPNFLHDLGVNVIISGGMGQGAVDIFTGHGIETVIGAKGTAEAVAEAYVKGDLAVSGSPCTEHNH
ncbi:MAG TPA: NifB/NifX family molybdenum-iron cluster-binding protein [Sphaerochaeta sp.]|jgi:predicted Fe-Mo cluster-binding NifX family protein|nr:NifB/NifX family molybdenum-iron cluster-binding protein [Sphaerochaeta sp.]HQB54999.1 NifB/NifX family molybdenum-iron cluster-binding protein [Sphaerochaeta sp.]